MRKPPETPEKHVQESVARQKKVTTTAKKLAEEAESKATALAAATDLLSNRVATLADAVQINNHQIEQFKSELNRKPDDVELKFVERQASRERHRFLRFAIGTSLSAALISGYVAYDVANRLGRERCQVNAQNINTIVDILNNPLLKNQYAKEVADLQSNRNKC